MLLPVFRPSFIGNVVFNGINIVDMYSVLVLRFEGGFSIAAIIINLKQITYLSTFKSFTVSSSFSLDLCNLTEERKCKSEGINRVGTFHQVSDNANYIHV